MYICTCKHLPLGLLSLEGTGGGLYTSTGGRGSLRYLRTVTEGVGSPRVEGGGEGVMGGGGGGLKDGGGGGLGSGTGGLGAGLCGTTGSGEGRIIGGDP